MAECHIAIIGSGLIGRSWSMVFASAGNRVLMFDTDSVQLQNSLGLIHEQLTSLEKNNNLRGDLSAEEQMKLISVTNDLETCIKGAKYIQECIPENLELKKNLFHKLDPVVCSTSIIASSTSCILPSKLSESLKNRANFLVAHPVNPPYFVPLVEIVPAPWTGPEVVDTTRRLMADCGQSPVTLNKELPGFALNRIQYAILRECWNLVSEGILSVEDTDTVMTDGLGPRYAFIGPLETAHLNAEGFQKYCETYGETIYNVSQTLKPLPKMSGEKLQCISAQLEAKTPLVSLADRRAWRDENLVQLSRLKLQRKRQMRSISE